MAGIEILGLVALGLIGLGLAEIIIHRRRLGRIPTRIHVSGTRGKSSVTRLVAAALREAGVPTAAKTTGTAKSGGRENRFAGSLKSARLGYSFSGTRVLESLA